MGGVRWVQLRLKDLPYETHKAIALETQVVCSYYNAQLIINDHVQLAVAINADGVHLGKTDMAPAEARRLLGHGKIIGSTANTLQDILALAQQPIDYIGLGPFRFTTTKQNLSPILGLDGYAALLGALKTAGVHHPPIVGIGGVALPDVAALLLSGLHGIAVSGAISAQPDVKLAAQQFSEALQMVTL